MNRSRCSEHCRQRFNERVTKKSKRVEIFVARAYYYGKSSEEVSNKHLRNYLTAKQRIYGSIAKIYRGYIYWFQGGIATTVYPVPRNYREMLEV